MGNETNTSGAQVPCLWLVATCAFLGGCREAPPPVTTPEPPPVTMPEPPPGYRYERALFPPPDKLRDWILHQRSSTTNDLSEGSNEA